MRKSLIYIQLIVLWGVIVFLYSFSNSRNDKRSREDFDIDILHQQDLYITEDMLYEMMLGDSKSKSQKTLDSLNLDQLEVHLKSHGLIEAAEVYETITKKVGIEVRQREPIARVIGRTSYYIDRNGKNMPLSQVYTGRVPLIAEMDSLSLNNLFPLLTSINRDEFLKQQIIGIEKDRRGDYILKLRQHDFTVNFGSGTEVEKKINNFKVFYRKAKRDSLLKRYSQINLKYTNQVVCTKTDA